MKGFGPSTFGELYAEDYDKWNDPGTTDEAVDLLWEIAANRKTLELAIGTGRIAVPLAQRGLEIHGIDASPEMVAELRKRPGGATIPVSIGDMADVDIDGSFDFVFLIFNTLFNLRSQNDQIRCFQNASTRLNESGLFLIEAYVPDLSEFVDGQFVRTRHVGMNSAFVETAVHDAAAQTVEYQRIHMTETGTRFRPLPVRYAWPAEIDLMAKLAGLQLKDRWGSWTRAPFTGTSKMHVSLYEKSK